MSKQTLARSSYLVDECFPKGTQLAKIINRNTVKISYSCLPNMEAIIAKHNAKLANTTPNKTQDSCNCRIKKECPLEGKCLVNNVIYQATVTSENGNQESYIGISFKQRWTQHKSSFKNKEKKGETALSQHIWKLKEKEIQYETKWKILTRANSFSPITGKCNLCTKEKFYIIFRSDLCSLNTRNELATHCRHKNKMLLDET